MMLFLALACAPSTKDTGDTVLSPLDSGDADTDTDTDADTDADTDTDTDADVPCTLSAHPSAISFGEDGLGQTVSAFETIQNDGTETCTITTVTLIDNEVSMTPITSHTIEGGASATFTVSYAPQDPGTLDDYIHIASDDAANPDLTIHVTGSCPG